MTACSTGDFKSHLQRTQGWLPEGYYIMRREASSSSGERVVEGAEVLTAGDTIRVCWRLRGGAGGTGGNGGRAMQKQATALETAATEEAAATLKAANQQKQEVALKEGKQRRAATLKAAYDAHNANTTADGFSGGRKTGQSKNVCVINAPSGQSKDDVCVRSPDNSPSLLARARATFEIAGEEEVKRLVREVLTNNSLDDVTTHIVRQHVEASLGRPFTPYKALISEETLRYLLEERGRQAAIQWAPSPPSPPSPVEVPAPAPSPPSPVEVPEPAEEPAPPATAPATVDHPAEVPLQDEAAGGADSCTRHATLANCTDSDSDGWDLRKMGAAARDKQSRVAKLAARKIQKPGPKQHTDVTERRLNQLALQGMRRRQSQHEQSAIQRRIQSTVATDKLEAGNHAFTPSCPPLNCQSNAACLC